MARLNKIVRDNPLSNFRQTAPQSGMGFRALADAMDTAYQRMAPAATEEMEQRGLEWGYEDSRRAMGNVRMPSGGAPVDTLQLLREFEGFRETPYDDVNALRLGYGTDTITSADGTVRRVREGDRVTREDAERDLVRRVSTEFEPIARRAIGAEVFDGLSESQRAAVTSIAYNYGEIPDRIVGALRSGDVAASAAAIRGLGGDNDGVNRKRRNREAALFEGGGRISTRNEPEVTVRTEDGRLEGRKYSPYAGPILQAHDAAAKVAYRSETLNQATMDLLDISQQFLLDPEGFYNAADGYVSQLVENAPEDYRMELRQVLDKEVSQRRMGIMESKQRDIRRRADNSSSALVKRISTEYTEALAAGDPYEVAEKQQELDSVLRAREALPGVSWTQQQSENVFFEADRQAQAMVARSEKAQTDQYRSSFRTIIDAAKNGQHAADENILNDPAAVAAHPELAGEARAYVALRDNMPEFLTMTPAEQLASIARLREQEVTDDFQVDVVKAVESTAKANRKAWKDDPVRRASEVFPDRQPPSLPDLTPEQPEKFVAALTARREYMDEVFDGGYTDTRAYLSKDEAAHLKTLMGRDVAPEARAALAGAIASGFGAAAVGVFDQIDADKTTMFAGKLMSIGGSSAVAAEMLRGQTLLDEGNIQLPPKADRIASFSDDIASAFEGMPGALQAQTEVMNAAKAIYAARAQGIDPSSDDAKALLTESLQAALGQENGPRGRTGGVQRVGGHSTLLPPGVNGKDVDAALRVMFGAKPLGAEFGGIRVGPLFQSAPTEDAMSAVWEAAGGRPLINGKPIPSRFLDLNGIRLMPVAGNKYRMRLGYLDVEDADGNILMIDLPAMIEAIQ